MSYLAWILFNAIRWIVLTHFIVVLDLSINLDQALKQTAFKLLLYSVANSCTTTLSLCVICYFKVYIELCFLRTPISYLWICISNIRHCIFIVRTHFKCAHKFSRTASAPMVLFGSEIANYAAQLFICPFQVCDNVVTTCDLVMMVAPTIVRCARQWFVMRCCTTVNQRICNTNNATVR